MLLARGRTASSLPLCPGQQTTGRSRVVRAPPWPAGAAVHLVAADPDS